MKPAPTQTESAYYVIQSQWDAPYECIWSDVSDHSSITAAFDELRRLQEERGVHRVWIVKRVTTETIIYRPENGPDE